VTVGSSSNRLLLFEFAGKTGADHVTSVRFGGQPLTFLAARSQGSTRLELWYLINPPIGTGPLAWQKSGVAQNVTWGASVYAGVNQTSPFGPLWQAGATQDRNSGPKTLTVSGASGSLLAEAVVVNGGPTTGGPVAGTGQTVLWSRKQSTTQGGASTSPIASKVTVSWTPQGTPNYDWAIFAVPVQPAS
jgi:hypothetical protein